MKYAILGLCLLSCGLAGRLLNASLTGEEYKAAYYRCEDVADAAHAIMTKRQQWQWKARIEQLGRTK